jgi:RNA polymerase sigma factor (sigma-70 family)
VPSRPRGGSARSRGDGDDLYQESVLRAFEKLHTLRDEARFRSWFYATLLSRHRSRSRRWFWKRQVPLEVAFAGDAEPAGEDGGRWGERIQQAKRAADALSTLDAVQREVIVLFEIDGYTIEEIADMQRASLSGREVPAVPRAPEAPSLLRTSRLGRRRRPGGSRRARAIGSESTRPCAAGSGGAAPGPARGAPIR